MIFLITTKVAFAQFSSKNGYQYNRPNFGSDFGEHGGGNRPGNSYGSPSTSGLYGSPRTSSTNGGFNQGFQGGNDESNSGDFNGANNGRVIT